MNNTTTVEKFTPGPWDIQKMYGIIWIGTPKRYGQLDELILHINQDENYKDEKKERNLANAKLIAAAPDLYAACVEFCRKVEAGEARSTESYKQMKAAIQKVTQ